MTPWILALGAIVTAALSAYGLVYAACSIFIKDTAP